MPERMADVALAGPNDAARDAPGAGASAGPGPARFGFDACCFVGNPTGIGNYVGRLLKEMCAAHPDVQFIGYSNEETQLPESANPRVRVSTPRRRGPFWQNTQLVDMLRADAVDVFWGTNG